ncbi:MAG: hypothetical protein KDK45_12780, partial [Leptospiraceae bacterium]|nr:hypothetical protein [Leptospiraceae bacterium]
LSIFKNKGFRIYNADHTVKGKDYLGNLFVYNDKQIAVYEVEDHENCIKEYDMNATVYQVVCGLYAGICSLLLDPLTNEIYMITDLIYTENNKYGDYLTKHLRNWFEEITYDNQIALKKYLHSLTR